MTRQVIALLFATVTIWLASSKGGLTPPPPPPISVDRPASSSVSLSGEVVHLLGEATI